MTSDIDEEFKKAKRYAYWLLARKGMHSARLDLYLREKGYSEEIRAKTVEEAKNHGFLNDSDYVANFVAKWQKLGKSYLQIIEKARCYAIPLSEIKEVDNEEALKRLIEKRYPELLEKGADFKVKQKAINALCRRGFNLHQILKFNSQ